MKKKQQIPKLGRVHKEGDSIETTFKMAARDFSPYGWGPSRVFCHENLVRAAADVFGFSKVKILNDLSEDRVLVTAEGMNDILGVIYIAGLPVQEVKRISIPVANIDELQALVESAADRIDTAREDIEQLERVIIEPPRF